MLNNKKFGIRFFAIVLALLMTAAVFAGCQDKSAREAADKAKADAEAAVKAAADASAAAVSAADAAKALQAQLDDARKQIDEQKKLIDDQKKANDNLQSKVDQIEKNPADTDNIGKDDWDKTTEYVTKQILEELSVLKTKYLVTRQTHYTEVNFITLSQLFDKAYNDLYRATTSDSVKNVLSKLSADAAAVPSISSEAAAIKAQIDGLGNINTITTANKAAVAKVRADYIKWLKDYRTYFAMNGMSVDAYISKNIVVVNTVHTYTKAAFNIDNDKLQQAENTIALIEGYALDVAKAAYDAVAAVWGNDDYNVIKTSGAAIKAAYEKYLEFLNINGGDGSPIKHVDPADKTKVLTGEQFVQFYVHNLYDNWLYEYAEKADQFLEKLPLFFMNQGDASALDAALAGLDTKYLGIYTALSSAKMDFSYEKGAVVKSAAAITEIVETNATISRELKKVANDYSSKFLALSYSESFKRTDTLSDAFRAIDNEITKAAIEMANIYFKKVLVPALKAEMSNDFTTRVATKFSTGTGDGETLEYYKDADIKFYNQMVKVYDAYVAESDKFNTKTYNELNNVWQSDKTQYNIGQLSIFTYTISPAGDIVVSYETREALNPLVIALKSLNTTVKSATEKYYTSLLDVDFAVEFHKYRKVLAKDLEAYQAFVTNDANYIATVGAVRSFSAAEKTAIKSATESLAQSGRNAILNLDYNSFSSYMYQATNEKGEKLYYEKKAASSAKINTTASNNPLNIVVDKPVSARAAAIAIYAENADKMMNTVIEYARATAKSYITKAVDLYNANYVNETPVGTIKQDIEAYVAYMNNLADLNATTFYADYDSTVFAKIKYSSSDNVAAVMNRYGYKLEDATNYIFYYHIDSSSKYAAAANVAVDHKTVAGTTVSSYANIATAASANNAYKNLEKVRLLAFAKDQAILDLKVVLEKYTGVWDATKGEWVAGKAPVAGYEYDYASARKATYLNELTKVYDRLAAGINSITLLNSTVISTANSKYAGDLYAAAIALIRGDGANSVKGYFDYAENATSDGAKAASSKDDFSFPIAYQRYYKTTADGSPAYDWSKYNA